jgi:hypothetical protein
MTMAVCDQCEKEGKQLYYYSPDNTTRWLCILMDRNIDRFPAG